MAVEQNQNYVMYGRNNEGKAPSLLEVVFPFAPSEIKQTRIVKRQTNFWVHLSVL